MHDTGHRMIIIIKFLFKNTLHDNNYPEPRVTWAGYSSHSVCVCVCVSAVNS